MCLYFSKKTESHKRADIGRTHTKSQAPRVGLSSRWPGSLRARCGRLSDITWSGEHKERDVQKQEDGEQRGRRLQCCFSAAASSTRSAMRCALSTSALDLPDLRSMGCARALPITVHHGRHGNAASASLSSSHSLPLARSFLSEAFPFPHSESLRYSHFF
ncbi:hypothetical protein TNIN_191461 [Trichonephila inaurata madagascariensis]|uniref:Uncharacterized protein n=1 Tax=Trichonephila inaurata madagascariensis TaxID=2747483 RepID=A0A8X6M8K4_9ARAC|nr:hypothetical protein TNIN_191461 [Trichonephila inaurata madagascariensis]